MANREELIIGLQIDESGKLKLEELKRGMRTFNEEAARGNKEFVGIGGAFEAMGSKWNAAIQAMGINAVISIFNTVQSSIIGIVDALDAAEDRAAADRGLGALAQSAGIAKEQFDALLKSASQQEATDARLANIAARLEDSGVAAQNFGEVISWAWGQAERRGGDAEKAMSAVERAIATGQTTLLTKQGLYVDGTAAIERAAKRAGVAIEALSQEERQAAVEAEVVAAMTGRARADVESLGGAARQSATGVRDWADAAWQAVAGARGWGKSIEDLDAAFRESDLEGKIEVGTDAILAQIERREQLLAEQRRVGTQTVYSGGEGAGLADAFAEPQELKRLQNLIDDINLQTASAMNNLVKESVEAVKVATARVEAYSKTLSNVPDIIAGKARQGADALAEQAAIMGRTASVMQTAVTRLEGVSGLNLVSAQNLAADMEIAAQKANALAGRLAFVDYWTDANAQSFMQLENELDGLDDKESEFADTLRKSIAVYEAANKEIIGLADSITKLVDTVPQAALAMQILGDSATPDEILATSQEMQTLTEASKKFQDAIKTNDVSKASEALKDMRSATEQLGSVLLVTRGPDAYALAMEGLTRQMALAEAQASKMQAEFVNVDAVMTQMAGRFDRLQVRSGVSGLFGKLAGAEGPKKEKGGGGGGGRQDISQAEFEARIRLLRATTDLEKAQAQYNLELIKADEGKLKSREYTLANIEALDKYTDAVLAASRAELQAGLARQERWQAPMMAAFEALDAGVNAGYEEARAAGEREIAEAQRERLRVVEGLTAAELDYMDAVRNAQQPNMNQWQQQAADMRLLTAEIEMQREAWSRYGESISGIGDALDAATLSLDEMSTRFGGAGMNRTAMSFSKDIASMTKAAGKLAGASKDNKEVWADAAGELLTSTGQMAAGMTSDIGSASLLMGLFATANATLMAFSGQPEKAVGQGLAAAQYFVAAATAGSLFGGGGGGGGASARAQGTVAAMPQRAVAEGPTNVIVNVASDMIGTGAEIGHIIADKLMAADRSGNRTVGVR